MDDDINGLILFTIIKTAIIIVIALGFGWRIVRKAGYPGRLVFLFLVPIANIIACIGFAFGKWPVEVELEAYRAKYGPLGAVRPLPEEDTRDPITCLRCGETIPSGETKCPRCGWTYKPPPDKTGDIDSAAPVSPTPIADSFRDQRGF